MWKITVNFYIPVSRKLFILKPTRHACKSININTPQCPSYSWDSHSQARLHFKTTWEHLPSSCPNIQKLQGLGRRGPSTVLRKHSPDDPVTGNHLKICKPLCWNLKRKIKMWTWTITLFNNQQLILFHINCGFLKVVTDRYVGNQHIKLVWSVFILISFSGQPHMVTVWDILYSFGPVELGINVHIWSSYLLHGKFLDFFICPRVLEPRFVDALVNFGCIFSGHHFVDGEPASFHHPPLHKPSCWALVGPSDFPSYGYIFFNFLWFSNCCLFPCTLLMFSNHAIYEVIFFSS